MNTCCHWNGESKEVNAIILSDKQVILLETNKNFRSTNNQPTKSTRSEAPNVFKSSTTLCVFRPPISSLFVN